MTSDLASLVALPGAPDLDCHLRDLRVSSVVASDVPGYDVEIVLGFDTTSATGWWTDTAAGMRVELDRVTELTMGFGVKLDPGYQYLASKVTGRLELWRDERTPVELTAADGRWSLLNDGTDMVPIPRGHVDLSDRGQRDG